ncbi:MAG: biotin--[acetyl-CoA-carboxylase] ligase [Candidatus Omnitrophota bacterium]|jgi:BirA family biotin operon repressor/biotin-[acetyl-CoA-carboxylase] ligase
MKEIDIKKKILNIFYKNTGSFISGEDISDKLKVSRASVWKYINKIREDGYVIDAVPHLGYRITAVPDKLYGHEISRDLKTKNIGQKNVYHYEHIDSTNNKAYELAESGEPEGTIVVAEAQGKGKGRIGRKWASPKGEGVYMSLVLRPDVETDEIPTITLIAAISAVKAIDEVCSLKPKIKWPNDILVNSKKLGGILTEIKAQPDQVDFLILGIGINVNTHQDKIPRIATSLKNECSKRISRSEVVKRFLENFEKDYTKFKKEGFKSLRNECKSNSSVLGKKVKVTEHHKTLEGEAVDIDQKGALILKLDNGSRQRVFSGDVVLCR